MKQKEERKSVLRRTAAALFLLAGLACAVYGAVFHLTPVLVEKEQKAASAAPPQFMTPFAPFANAAPADQPPAKSTEIIQVSEPGLVRDVTVGGVVRLASGEVKRTYTGKPLSLCPT